MLHVSGLSLFDLYSFLSYSTSSKSGNIILFQNFNAIADRSLVILLKDKLQRLSMLAIHDAFGMQLRISCLQPSESIFLLNYVC